MYSPQPPSPSLPRQEPPQLGPTAQAGRNKRVGPNVSRRVCGSEESTQGQEGRVPAGEGPPSKALSFPSPCRPSFPPGQRRGGARRREGEPHGRVAFPTATPGAPRSASAAHAENSSADPPADLGGGTCGWPARLQGTLPGLRGAAERADSRSRYVSGEPSRAGPGGGGGRGKEGPSPRRPRALVVLRGQLRGAAPRARRGLHPRAGRWVPILIFTALWPLRGCDL